MEPWGNKYLELDEVKGGALMMELVPVDSRDTRRLSFLFFSPIPHMHRNTQRSPHEHIVYMRRQLSANQEEILQQHLTMVTHDLELPALEF
jgi:hypothetical protein